MTKWKTILLLMLVVICAVVFKLSIRYKDVEVGAFDLRYDRLTSEHFLESLPKKIVAGKSLGMLTVTGKPNTF